MYHIGVDIIEIARIEKAINRWGEVFLNRVFTEGELNLFRSRPSSLAARFAGKEAVIKALGTPWARGFRWQDVEILSEVSGQPVINLYGKAKNQANVMGLGEIAISLAHSREYAIAFVIADRTGDWRL